MQRKFKNRLIIMDTKLDLLEIHWIRTLEQIKKRANDQLKVGKDEDNNERMLMICAAIDDVPNQVRRSALKMYLKSIQLYTYISFYKTRLVEQKDVCNEGDILLAIFSIVFILKKNHLDSKSENLIDEDVMEKYELSDEILRDYQLLDTVKTAKLQKSWQINQFKELGWYDPFPDKALLLKRQKEALT